MVLLAQAWSLIYQFWIHTERIKKLPAPLEYVLNTPSHHRVHHGSNEVYLDKNYGGILIIWDRMFGTFEGEGERVRYGLTKNIRTFSPVKAAFHEYVAMWHDLKRTPALARQAWDPLPRSRLEPAGDRPAPDGIEHARLGRMPISTREARERILGDIAAAVDAMAFALACLSEAFEQLSVGAADRMEGELYRPGPEGLRPRQAHPLPVRRARRDGGPRVLDALDRAQDAGSQVLRRAGGGRRSARRRGPRRASGLDGPDRSRRRRTPRRRSTRSGSYSRSCRGTRASSCGRWAARRRLLPSFSSSCRSSCRSPECRRRCRRRPSRRP